MTSNWLLCSVLTLICWSGSDLFSKIGCRDSEDRYGHLKMLTAVGFVMGAHALFNIFTGKAEINLHVFLTYLPVSFLYILSMAIGYLGLRYIELSISSPICNSSGAIVAILTLITSGISPDLPPVSFVAVALVCAGVIMLGITEAREDDDLRKKRQEASNYQYSKSPFAIILPVIYCLLDALGTFADSMVLEKLDENSANCAYELTFLAVGLASLVYVKAIKKQHLVLKNEMPKYTGAVFETVGQFFYIFAIADEDHVAFSAPIISAYCIASCLWSRIFLKEKLSYKHYLCIGTVTAGIIILGILDI